LEWMAGKGIEQEKPEGNGQPTYDPDVGAL
jgi:hypothetical protein